MKRYVFALFIWTRRICRAMLQICVRDVDRSTNNPHSYVKALIHTALIFAPNAPFCRVMFKCRVVTFLRRIYFFNLYAIFLDKDLSS